MVYRDASVSVLREAAAHLAGWLSAQAGAGNWTATGVTDDEDGYPRAPSVCGPGGAMLVLTNPDPALVTMRRIHVAGIYPGGRGWIRRDTKVVDAINVALARGWDALGREVERRLLPGYLPQLEHAQKALAEHTADIALRRAIRDDLVDRIPGAYVIDHAESDYRSTVILPIGGDSGSRLAVELYRDGRTAKVDGASLPNEFVEQLVQLLETRTSAHLREAA